MLAMLLLARSIDAVLADDAGQNSIEFALIVVMLTLATVATLYVLSGTIVNTWIDLSVNTPSSF